MNAEAAADLLHRPIDIGHNRPPIREVLSERNGELVEFLVIEGADLINRRDELLAAAARVPETIDDADTAQRAADFAKQLAACVKAAETRRVGDKEPTLQAGRLIDGWYRRISDPLDKALAAIKGRLTTYQRAVADAERRRRQEEERLAREAAETARREAAERERSARDAATLQTAIEADATARQAEADAARAAVIADAKPAEMSRVRGDYGALSSLRTVWTGEILDRDALDLEALRAHLPIDGLQKAVNAFVRAGGRDLRGAKIYERQEAVVR